jgi:Peptidase C13 family
MRFLILFFLLISLLKCGSEAAFAQALPGSRQASTDGISNLTWKATLMTGDDSLDVFDNARKTLKSEFLNMGVIPANIKELSMNPLERKRGSLPSSAVNLAGALRELSIGDQDACLIHMTSHGSPQGFYLRNASPISPQMLNRILDLACSERPTVVLISACYSGVFVGPSMQKKNRIILTAARQDRTSFGCSAENQYTFWDSCLIDSLPTAESWKSLYGIIQRCVETKELQGHFKPSFPQAYFGEQVSDLKIPNTVTAAFSVVSIRRPSQMTKHSDLWRASLSRSHSMVRWYPGVTMSGLPRRRLLQTLAREVDIIGYSRDHSPING